jgi:hypothetical protein
MNTSYGIHPSQELCALFASMPVPYQGQDPGDASVLFIGLDANYAPELFEFPEIKARIFEYHRDGPKFWQHHGVHHPFLLDEYPSDAGKDGLRYHKQFRKMGLGAEFADHICFTELLSVPTFGRTNPKVFWTLFDPGRGQQLDKVLCGRHGPRAVLFSKSVIRYMHLAQKKFGLFSWLPKSVDWGLIGKVGRNDFYLVKHFSAAISNAEIDQIGRLVRSYCARDET